MQLLLTVIQINYLYVNETNTSKHLTLKFNCIKLNQLNNKNIHKIKKTSNCHSFISTNLTK